MKTKLALMSLLLAGCTSMPPPTSSVEGDWLDYGKLRAEQGLLKQSEQKLTKLDDDGVLNSQLYLAYSNGYEQGRATYCSQNAYMLGVTGKPYLGICDRLDPFFQQDYNSGRSSTAGSI
ncbi:hypothetical protein TW81_15145 [Vibrio galatheae]|uniref:Lipoprotein n=1 Tax=Vibrio galatheae TaxID=579748 RepID=A0A0F4NIY3_9VIBR|nr:DUF2799 domain-containing protein [Vibrio galatheae]KJY82021.1 hypothetical protein TW81_15145 [Vibrio galatheae]